jgi:hypothetical protein
VTVSGSGLLGTVRSPSTNNTLLSFAETAICALAPSGADSKRARRRLQHPGEPGAIHERSLRPVEPQISLQAIPFQIAVPRPQ